jgi:hypothetical protein
MLKHTGALHRGWESIQHCALSLDMAERAARRFVKGGPATAEDEEWGAVANELRRLARAVCEGAGRMPIEWQGSASHDARGWRNTAPGDVWERSVNEYGSVVSGPGPENTAAYPAGTFYFPKPGCYTYVPGWTLASLTANVDGMLAADHAAAVAAPGIIGTEKARQRWAAFEAGGPLDTEDVAKLTPRDEERLRALWAPYLAPFVGEPTIPGQLAGHLIECERLEVLARAAWELLKHARQREAEAGQLPVILWEGDTYVGASKAAPATSWALGAPGHSEVVEWHGEQYATIHKPRVVGVVHGGLPGQRIVQLAFPFQTEAAALVTLAANDAAVLSPLAGKLLVWLLATVPTAGHYPTTLEGLARAMHKHTRFRREYTARTAEALAPLEELRLVLEDHTFVRLFDMRAALKTAAPDAPIEVGYSPAMMRATHPFHHTQGEVLINRSAIERMPLEYRGALYLRAYVRSAGWWNDHLGMGQPLPEYTAEALAGVFNAMSAHAATDPGAGRKQKSKAVKGVEEALDWLEGERLAVLHQRGAGRHRRMSVKPPEAHVEAYRERRKRGARPDG